ncbi:MAG: UDP-N-acetylmuramate dehydrogenase [Nitrospirota bacterium]
MKIHIRGEIRKNEPLSRHTSFGIGGPADIFACPIDAEDVNVLLHAFQEQNIPYFVLGGGTNLLVRDGGFRGAVICLKHMNMIKIEREYRSIGGTFFSLSAEGGALMPKLVSVAAEEGLTGFEFAAGIPGTVGGAVRMNAGTAMGDISGVIHSVTLISPDSTITIREREEIGFGYRKSSIPNGSLVLNARISLRRDDKDKVKARVQELLDKRKERQPWRYPNAGSIFKNPNEKPAGVLIESAGLKGKKVGSAQISDKHCNFIVTIGEGKAADVIELMDMITKTVLDRHGVRLEPEIQIIGED